MLPYVKLPLIIILAVVCIITTKYDYDEKHTGTSLCYDKEDSTLRKIATSLFYVLVILLFYNAVVWLIYNVL